MDGELDQGRRSVGRLSTPRHWQKVGVSQRGLQNGPRTVNTSVISSSGPANLVARSLGRGRKSDLRADTTGIRVER